jgi:hypothetical protein
LFTKTPPPDISLSLNVVAFEVISIFHRKNCEGYKDIVKPKKEYLGFLFLVAKKGIFY